MCDETFSNALILAPETGDYTVKILTGTYAQFQTIEGIEDEPFVIDNIGFFVGTNLFSITDAEGVVIGCYSVTIERTIEVCPDYEVIEKELSPC